jgi:hypothetical protein
MARSPLSAFSRTRLTIYSAGAGLELSSNPENFAMMKKLFLLLPAVLGPSLFLTGAWRGPVPPTASLPPPPFLAQTVSLNRALIGDNATGAQLLDRALAQLAPSQLVWLRTEVWQKMTDARLDFEAEGTLDLAPGACARLDLAVRTPTATGRLLTLTDGHVLAHLRHFGDAAPVATSEPLPALAPGTEEERRRFLADRGCGGPGPLLAGLRRELSQMRLETGTYRGQPAIEIKGEFGAGTVAAPLPTTTPIRYACVYLDAQTLWPLRLEWWGLDPKYGARPIVQMEFRAPVLNRALPLQECARLFSYQPAPGAYNKPAPQGPEK